MCKMCRYVIHTILSIRPVVPGCAGCAMAHPDFGRSVNPISTSGDRLCPTNYYWHTRIFRPSDGPVYERHVTKSGRNRVKALQIVTTLCVKNLLPWA